MILSGLSWFRSRETQFTELGNGDGSAVTVTFADKRDGISPRLRPICGSREAERFENADLAAALSAAKDEKLYDDVLHINGRRQRHYALTNQMEYFAEQSEALFGTNDFFPFVRSELEHHDPRMFSLLNRLWRPDDDDKK